MKHFFVVLLMVSYTALRSQELPTIIPPSPTSFELGKYGEIPIGMFTGTANISIPMKQYSTKNLSVPISLSYNSNGLRVDQMSSWVGLGWSLNAGGVITRMIKDEDDDGIGAGLLQNSPDQEIEEMINSPAGTSTNPRVAQFFDTGKNGGVDSEYDIYNFNFQGTSGRFILDRKNRIHILSDNPLIKITTEGYGFNRTFTITANNGVTYHFADTESSKVLLPATASNIPPRATTSWYITSMTHPLGDQINFLYDTERYEYVQGINESYSKLSNIYSGCPDHACTQGTLYESESLISIYGLRLREINSNSATSGKVTFRATTTHSNIPIAFLNRIQVLNQHNAVVDQFELEYDFTSNNRAFLDRVVMKDTSLSYDLSYIDKNSFPNRLSKAQDYWGYFNGKINNTHFVPRTENPIFNNFGADRNPYPIYGEKGLLKRITYPTKGYNEFIYEANTTMESTIDRQRTQKAVSTSSESPNPVEQNFTIPENLDTSPLYPITVQASMDLDGFSCPTCNGNGVISIYDNTENKEVFSHGITRDQSVENKISLSKNHNYTMSISTSGNLNFVGNLFYFTLERTEGNIIKAGQRVKELHTKDHNHSTTNKKYYRYEKFDTPGISSGVRGASEVFFKRSKVREVCEDNGGTGGTIPTGAFADCRYETLFSSSTNSLLNQRSSAIYYQYVCVSNGTPNFENGAEEHEFIISRNTSNQLIFGSAEFAPIEFFNEDAVNNGFTKKVTLYAKKESNFIKVQETINNYEKDETYTNAINSYIIQQDFNPMSPVNLTYTCKAPDINKRYSFYNCINTSHTHFWHTENGYQCIAPGHNNVLQYRNHPCYDKALNSTIEYQSLLDGGIDYYISVVRNQNVSERYYMDNTIFKVYDPNGENPLITTTQYYYDNTFHRLPTRKGITDSNGHNRVTKTYYPDDITSLSSLSGGNLTQTEYNAINSLKRIYQNQSTLPIQIEQYNIVGDQEILLSTQRTLFKDWGNKLILPQEVKTSKDTDDLSPRIEYLSYDAKGNPLEVSQANGTHIIYIWGYHGQYPIAKITNATYSGMPSGVLVKINQIKTATNTENTAAEESAVRSQLANLQSDPFFADAQMSYYTYDPLVGVTSQTDPRGYTMFYQYDGMNRLEMVKDQQGNILSENAYHYKNN